MTAPKLRLFLLSTTPFLISILLVLLYLAPKSVSHLNKIMPMVFLVPIFLWSVMHARHMPIYAVAMIGVMIDSVQGLPMGLSGFILCLCTLVLRAQRKYILKEGFVGMWGYFLLFSAAIQALYWLLFSGMNEQTPPLSALLMQWVLTVLLYPLFHYLLYPIIEKLSQTRYRLLHV